MSKYELVSLAISIIAILFSMYTYFTHDRKIKRQTELINKQKLERFQLENVQSKKAHIEIFVFKSDGGKCSIRVYNNGKSSAKNVVVKFNSAEVCNSISNNLFPANINVGNFLEIVYYLNKESPEKVETLSTWDDEYQNKNSSMQTVFL